MTTTQERRIRLYFDISIILKGVISFAEMAAGVLLLFVPVSTLANIIIQYAEGELAEEPGDFIATHLILLAQQFSVASGIFIAVYLFSRGIIKLELVAALLKNQFWAYPASLVILGLFVLYQIYQYVVGQSVLIAILTAFDLVVMYFIWREYRIVKIHFSR